MFYWLGPKTGSDDILCFLSKSIGGQTNQVYNSLYIINQDKYT